MSKRSAYRRLACRCAGAILALCLTTNPAYALDFRLHAATIEEDGFKREQTYFQNDAQTRVTIAPPAGWTREDDPASLTLTPPDLTHGMVRIERSSVGPAVTFQDAGLVAYRKRILADLPQGVTDVKQAAEIADPLPIFNWKSREFTMDYELFGQSYRRSVLFLNLNTKEQLMMTTVALTHDFDRVHTAGMDVLRSWQVLPALP